MNLKFKSSEPDLKFNIQSQLLLMNKNILYITRELNSIRRIVTGIREDKLLQKQVDDFYETSHQTEQTTNDAD